MKDKAFFFVNYEGFRASRTVSNVATVPDAHGAPVHGPERQRRLCPRWPRIRIRSTAAAVRAGLKLYPVADDADLRNGLPTGTGFVTMANNTLSYENYLIGRLTTLSEQRLAVRPLRP